jgi:AraC-like DNA-binding protein
MSPLSLLRYPYARLQPITGHFSQIRAAAGERGTALVWFMEPRQMSRSPDLVCRRPGGVALLVVLPPEGGIGPQVPLLQILDRARPLGILPFHADVSPEDLAQVLRRQPSDLGAEVTEYLRWRGLGADRETSQLIRRIIDLSAELRTISAVCRRLYVSRRSLGRRLMCRGLPVPSHWLHIGRILRVASRLQNRDATVSSVACDLGYPDGFSVSNQMERLVGVRPSDVRGHLGWEWLFEAWLRREAERGGLAPAMMRCFWSDDRDATQIGALRGRAPLGQTRRAPPVPTDG